MTKPRLANAARPTVATRAISPVAAPMLTAADLLSRPRWRIAVLALATYAALC